LYGPDFKPYGAQAELGRKIAFPSWSLGTRVKDISGTSSLAYAKIGREMIPATTIKETMLWLRK
jgi:hypothetical protein